MSKNPEIIKLEPIALPTSSARLLELARDSDIDLDTCDLIRRACIQAVIESGNTSLLKTALEAQRLKIDIQSKVVPQNKSGGATEILERLAGALGAEVERAREDFVDKQKKEK